MNSTEWIKKCEAYLNQKRDYSYYLKERGELKYGQQVMKDALLCEEAIRELGFTIRSKGKEGVEIKCKWSDAPEKLKNVPKRD